MNGKRWLGLVLVGLILSAAAGGCGQGVGPGGEVVSIMVKGSDTEVNLVARLAEEFMKERGGVVIAVTGGGSRVGIAALIDGEIDITNSSRPMKDSEIADLKAKQGRDAFAVRFAVDGLAVIVNADNPLEEITLEDLGKVYRGEITRWSELGGADEGITLYGRQSTSGTYVFFMETVLKGDYAPTMRNQSGNAAIVEAVKSDRTGFGYVGIGYASADGKPVPGLKALKIAAAPGAVAYSPVILENITGGNYPLTRPLYQFVAGKPEGALLDFLKFETGAAGQAIVLEEGFYPITAADKGFNRTALE